MDSHANRWDAHRGKPTMLDKSVQTTDLVFFADLLAVDVIFLELLQFKLIKDLSWSVICYG